MPTLSTDDVMRYTRIALQWLAATLVTHGQMKGGAYVEQGIGVAVALVSLGWTLYGNRINAQIAELAAKRPDIVIVANEALAAAHAMAPNVLSKNDVKVVDKTSNTAIPAATTNPTGATA